MGFVVCGSPLTIFDGFNVLLGIERVKLGQVCVRASTFIFHRSK